MIYRIYNDIYIYPASGVPPFFEPPPIFGNPMFRQSQVGDLGTVWLLRLAVQLQRAQIPPTEKWCLTISTLLVLSREWMGLGVAGIIIDSYCGSFPKIPY